MSANRFDISRLSAIGERKRKKGREMIAGTPSRFIAEMGLDKTTVKEDPREKIRALRAEFALKVEAEKALADKAGHNG